jgi:MFS family permease
MASAEGVTATVGARVHHPGMILFALLLAEITGAYETAMIYAAVNQLIIVVGDPIAVGWLVTSYLLVSAGTAAVIGRLGDIYGRRRMILILLFVGAVGSLISAATDNFTVILAGRAIQGLTGAILPLCIGLVRENVAPAKVPMGIGLMISGNTTGSAFGLVLGGLIVDTYSWHGIFIASAIFATLSWLAILLWVPRSVGTGLTSRLDWISGVLFMPGVVGLLLVVSYGGKWGWLGWQTLLLAAVAIALLAIWIRHSLRVADPLIDLRLFAHRPILISNLVTAFAALGASQVSLVFMMLMQAPTWTGVGLGVSATVAGLVKLPSNVLGLLAGPLAGFLIGRRGARFVMVLGGALLTGGWLMIMFNHGTLLVVGILLCLISFGVTILITVPPSVTTSIAPEGRTSEAAALTMAVRQTFYAIGSQVVAVLLASQAIRAPEGGHSYPAAGAFLLVMGAIAASCFVATLIGATLPETRRRPIAAAPASAV